ncbi:MAG: right-handed parallel beta-helix repeat-containing protein [Bacteroidota bacterium]
MPTIKFSFLFLLCILSQSSFTQNIIPNASFEDGIGDWDKGAWGGAAATISQSTTFATDGENSVNIAVTTISEDNPFKIYVRRKGVRLRPFRTYTLSFDVRSDSGLEEMLGISLYSHPNIGSAAWGEVWKDDAVSFQGNDEWQSIEITFLVETSAGVPDYTNLGLMFGFGHHVSTYYLDNICFREKDNDCTPNVTTKKTFYVAKDGDDANVGSESEPFLSIGKAAGMMNAGDICYIKEGIYRESLSPSQHGTSDEPITFTNYDDDEVVITATEAITDWTVSEGKVYQSAVDMQLDGKNMLYYNDQPMDLARWPNNEDHDLYTVEAVKVTGGSGEDMTLGTAPPTNLTGAKVWYLGAHSGTSWTRPVTGMSGSNIQFEKVDVNKWPFSAHHPGLFRNGNRGQCFFFDQLELLDYEREWYYDDIQRLVYFQLPDGASIDNTELEYAAREHCIFIDRDYIVVDGLKTFGGKVHVRGDHCVVKNNLIQHGLHMVDELDNTSAQVGNGAVHIQGSNNLLEGNVIEYGSHNGIWIQGWGGVKNNTIRQNVIRYFNTVGIHSSPIRSASEGTKIINNTLYNTGRDGIYAPALNCEIAYNDISRCMLINNDGGIFYVVGNDDDKKSSIHHNWFHDTYGPDYADGRSAGIYLDNRSKGYDVHHNVVWNIDWSAVQMNWDANDNDIFNNTFWNVDQAMGIWLNGYVQRNNRIWNNYASVGPWEGQDFEANIINANNPFVDVETHDFRPKAGSFLIDQGIKINGITDGYNGAAPDVGAYESGGVFWVAGATELILTSTEEQISIEDHLPTISIAPNPVTHVAFVNIQLPSLTPVSWEIISVTGKSIANEHSATPVIGSQNFTFDVSQLQKGLYFITIKTKDGLFSEKLMVQ